jgi:hypothetical protein
MSTKMYEVRYMVDRTGELLGTDLTMAAAQALVNYHAEGMHPEQVADLVIREIKNV